MGLLRNVAGVLLTSAAAVPIAFAASIVLARCLSVADRGFYALLTGFAAIVFLLTQLGWAEAVIYRTRRHGVSARTALSTGLLANGGLAVLALLICLVLREPLSHAFLEDVGARAFVLAALTAPLLVIADLLRGIARAIDRFDIQNSYSLLQSAGILGGLVLVLPVAGGATRRRARSVPRGAARAGGGLRRLAGRASSASSGASTAAKPEPAWPTARTSTC